MHTILFANGERHDCGGYSAGGGDMAFVTLTDVDVVDAARIFSDSNCTQEMTILGNRLVGYTTLCAISIVDDGVQATLRGGYYERGN